MRRIWRTLITISLVVGILPVAAAGVAVAGDAVVTTCDETSFDTALATALSGGGTITFSCSGTITFTSVKTITAGNPVVIDGGGTVTLDGGDATRMFNVEAGATLELREIAINNGNDGSDVDIPDPGGAIHVLGTLRTFDSSFDSNEGGSEGGAIDNDGGTIEIARTSFTNNTAAFSGAIDNDPGVLTITGSTFSGNSATIAGGVAYNSGNVRISASNFSGNTAQFAGAIANDPAGDVTVEATTFIGNSAIDFGGAIDSGGYVMVSTSTFIDNSARFAGAIGSGGELIVAGSTFIGNSAELNGGAIGNQPGTTTVSTSTFYDNSAQFGGGIYSDDDLSVTASTLINNSASLGGGGIRNSGGDATIASSIVAANTSPSGPNCGINGGTTTSLGSNLSDDDSCPFTASGDIQNSTNIDVAAPADNGGPTETMLPALSSDAVDNAACGVSSAADQRGISRPQGPACDIGAVERVLGATYTLCASYYTGAVSSPLSGGCGNGTVEITPFDKTFCIDSYTGKLLYQFGRPCAAPRISHTLPDDGDLLTCVSLYTGANRWVSNHSQCNAYELANTIPASP